MTAADPVVPFFLSVTGDGDDEVVHIRPPEQASFQWNGHDPPKRHGFIPGFNYEFVISFTFFLYTNFVSHFTLHLLRTRPTLRGT